MDVETKAFLFPGQGAQTLGMGVDLADEFPEAFAVFEAGKEVLGVDFLEICRNGPEEELHSTRFSQPAIFLHSMAMLEVLGGQFGCSDPLCRDYPARAAAGLSLGEYSALVFAGSLDFYDALRIVGRRGEYMQEACDSTRGSMASVLGMDAENVEEAVEKARSQGLDISVANYNSPDQTVISGEASAVEETVQRLKEKGASRAIPLKVAGAYHSSLMAEATAKLKPLLKEITIQAPRIPFYANVSGFRVEDPEQIRSGLIWQVESPVRWKDILKALLAEGLEEAYEVGPGKVIRGLVRGMSRDVKVAAAGTCADLRKLARDGHISRGAPCKEV